MCIVKAKTVEAFEQEHGEKHFHAIALECDTCYFIVEPVEDIRPRIIAHGENVWMEPDWNITHVVYRPMTLQTRHFTESDDVQFHRVLRHGTAATSKTVPASVAAAIIARKLQEQKLDRDNFGPWIDSCRTHYREFVTICFNELSMQYKLWSEEHGLSKV